MLPALHRESNEATQICRCHVLNLLQVLGRQKERVTTNQTQYSKPTSNTRVTWDNIHLLSKLI
jgi:hypothetical protein